MMEYLTKRFDNLSRTPTPHLPFRCYDMFYRWDLVLKSEGFGVRNLPGDSNVIRNNRFCSGRSDALLPGAHISADQGFGKPDGGELKCGTPDQHNHGIASLGPRFYFH